MSWKNRVGFRIITGNYVKWNITTLKQWSKEETAFLLTTAAHYIAVKLLMLVVLWKSSSTRLGESGRKQASYPLRVSCPLRRTLCWTSPSGFPLKRLACRPPSPWACTIWKDAQHTAAHPSTTLAAVQAPISPCRAAPWVLALNTHYDCLDTSELHLTVHFLSRVRAVSSEEVGVNKYKLLIVLTTSCIWLCFLCVFHSILKST